jgi:hypothetical protein
MSLDQLFEMTHDKVKKNFVSLYCNGIREIIHPVIEQEFELLQFYREYYSYSMPFNEFFSDITELKKPTDFIRNRLMHCYQIACLLSNIIDNSSKKFGIGELTESNIY